MAQIYKFAVRPGAVQNILRFPSYCCTHKYEYTYQARAIRSLLESLHSLQQKSHRCSLVLYSCAGAYSITLWERRRSVTFVLSSTVDHWKGIRVYAYREAYSTCWYKSLLSGRV